VEGKGGKRRANLFVVLIKNDVHVLIPRVQTEEERLDLLPVEKEDVHDRGGKGEVLNDEVQPLSVRKRWMISLDSLKREGTSRRRLGANAFVAA
jgi:hypothetical protein